MRVAHIVIYRHRATIIPDSVRNVYRVRLPRNIARRTRPRVMRETVRRRRPCNRLLGTRKPGYDSFPTGDLHARWPDDDVATTDSGDGGGGVTHDRPRGPRRRVPGDQRPNTTIKSGSARTETVCSPPPGPLSPRSTPQRVSSDVNRTVPVVLYRGILANIVIITTRCRRAGEHDAIGFTRGRITLARSQWRQWRQWRGNG